MKPGSAAATLAQGGRSPSGTRHGRKDVVVSPWGTARLGSPTASTPYRRFALGGWWWRR